jgi:hypothetical protein
MSNNSYKNRNNLLKGIDRLCTFIIFGYYAYQDTMNRNMLERNLNENAATPQRDFSHKSSRLQRCRTWECGSQRCRKETQYAVSKDLNDCNTFNERLNEYPKDPEDKITYPPEIYDALIDDEENKLIIKEIDY